jgi:hypothetical protein
VLAAYIIRAMIIDEHRRARLHGATSQKTVIFMVLRRSCIVMIASETFVYLSTFGGYCDISSCLPANGPDVVKSGSQVPLSHVVKTD